MEGINVTAIDYSKKDTMIFILNKKLIAPHYKEKPILFRSADPYVEFIEQKSII
ncbi:hypothetical protein [Senegalia massiliensis]|uniref:hypothetical protein n=1 Tax=Senegalia massiliensis TaxID=1720316 RepID=UPI001363D496|nr:hypothetical protein [Senegalia massiliensis]